MKTISRFIKRYSTIALLFPVMAGADVFTCPEITSLDMTWNQQKQRWEQKLADRGHDLPAPLQNAMLVADGVYQLDHRSGYLRASFPVRFFFSGAIFRQDENLIYQCNYSSHDLPGMDIYIKLSDTVISKAHKLPLLVEPYGDAWEKTGELFWHCDKSLAKCQFSIPQISARYTSFTPPGSIVPKNSGITLMALMHDAELHNITLNHNNGTRFSFFQLEGVKADHNTRLLVRDKQGSVDIFNLMESPGPGSSEDEECELQSDQITRCSCKQVNILKSINSNGHSQFDIKHVTNQSKETKSIKCSLFNIPAYNDHHDSSHSEEAHQEL